MPEHDFDEDIAGHEAHLSAERRHAQHLGNLKSAITRALNDGITPEDILQTVQEHLESDYHRLQEGPTDHSPDLSSGPS